MSPRTTLLAGTLLLAVGSPLNARAELPLPTPAVQISNLEITEGDSGTTPFTVSVSLGYYYGGTLPVTLKVTATQGTASDKDFVFTTTQVSLGAADAGVQTVSGYIVGDMEPEGDETFFLTATAVANDGGYAPYLYSSGGLITIKDDDQARASRLHVEGVTVLEGNPGTSQAEVRVILEPASTSTVTVAYQSQDGTAVAKSDYLPVSGTLSFAPGEVLKTVSIDILGDNTFEADETFSIVLSQPTMALLGAFRADVVIVNDDVASPPPDALPPTSGVDFQSDAGVVGSKDGASSPAAEIDSSPASAADAGGGADSGAGGSAVRDSGSAQGNDSGAVASAGNDSGAGARTGFGPGCSCSVGEGGRPTGMFLLFGVALAGWLRRKRP